jgi:hypothetical protein
MNPELRTVMVVEYTKMTTLSGDGRRPIGIKDFKPGMTVVTDMSANRVGDTSWKLNALHVVDPSKLADPALVKLVPSGPGGFVGVVMKINPGDATRKGDLGSLVVKRGADTLTLHISPETVLLRQAADGSQTPVSFSQMKVGCEVAASYPAALTTGRPPQAPATRVILVREAR